MESLGPYRLVRRLGSGGMGVVHEAWDAGLARPVALKVLSPQLADDPAFRARFTREARAQAALTSEHVVPVYAHGEDDGRLWIATQLVPDGDLGRLLREYGAPPVPVALDLVGQVASGLADAHAAGLEHRDIKPANVLLRRGPRIRAYLCDFGIAGPVGGPADDSGTPAYMSPEGVASDVYALGCLLWATLDGRPPRPGGPVPQLPGTDHRTLVVNRVLARALAADPADRYPSAAAFRDDLARAAALPDGPVRRRRWWLVGPAVAAVALVAVAGAVWALTRDGDAPPPAPQVAVEERATSELADSLTSAMNDVQATCVAAYVVDDLGFATLVDAGFFDEDGRFLDPDLADAPHIKDSLTRAAQSCVG
ncbi:MAG TPA: serine/threonine-protein kinase [Nocardioides sp.]|nr:serine/threonine-protein kinase [Nocardioides sp.]